MMKKVLYGVFMAFFAVMTMGSLQSCTDDLDRFEHQTAVNFQNLDGDLSALKAEVAKNKAECEANIADLQRQITANDGDIDKLQKDLKALAAEVDNRVTFEKLAEDLAALEKTLKDYSDAKDAELQKALGDQLDAAVATVNARIDELDEGYQKNFKKIEGEIDGLTQDLAKAWVKINNTSDAVDAITSELDNLKATVEGNTEKIAELTNEFVAFQKKYDEEMARLNSDLQEAFLQIQQTQGFITQVMNLLQSEIDGLQNQVDNLLTAVEALEDEFDLLTDRVNDLITSILVQATDSPVFGNFSLPLGIQSNMLFNWFFENKGMGYTFPNAAPEYAYNAAEILNGGRDVVSAEDVATAIASKNSTYAVPEGYADVFLGDLYLTINPAGHNVLNGKTFYLETSKGEEGRLPLTLDVKESDQELLFGYSRSAANGFYASEVVVPGDAASVAASKVSMDEELKEAGKAMLNDRSKRSVLNFLQAVYDQVNGCFPRYAVRAEWADPNKGTRQLYSVFSNYDLNVATAKPLSYAFLDGKGTSHRLRTFGHIDNLINRINESGKLHFDVSGKLGVPEFPEITLGTVSVDGVNTNLTIEIGDTKYNVEGMSGQDGFVETLRAAIQNALDQAGANVSADMQQYINDAVASIEKQVNDMINGKIDSILSKLQEKGEPWFQRLNKLIDIYNRVANKVNAFLAEPNEYLQPAMFYKTADGLGIVSMAQNDPTVFANGGGEAFELYATSYTAELIAPAFKKMIACINVIDNATGNYVSNGRELAKAFNATSDGLGVVLEGSTYGITIPGSALKAGKTYEIMYQALDYSGLTSTRKFYIKVK